MPAASFQDFLAKFNDNMLPIIIGAVALILWDTNGDLEALKARQELVEIQITRIEARIDSIHDLMRKWERERYGNSLEMGPLCAGGADLPMWLWQDGNERRLYESSRFGQEDHGNSLYCYEWLQVPRLQ